MKRFGFVVLAVVFSLFVSSSSSFFFRNGRAGRNFGSHNGYQSFGKNLRTALLCKCERAKDSIFSACHRSPVKARTKNKSNRPMGGELWEK